METIKIDILNPKANALLKDLANLDLIRIRKEKVNIEFAELLEKFRKKSDSAPSLEEIQKEVDAAQKEHDK